ncbi:MAG: hypothetical protein H7Y12_06715, partial [Sphingobacteriaceae bacterium]|nr:hypothetical protein [Cytophagaceae bacterium]
MTRSALTFFLMLLAAGLRAQGPSVQYRFRHLSVADGLPQGSVYFMHQDRRGFMWLGTTDGLARFDGRNWRTFYSSLTGRSVTVYGIVEAPNGDLWIGSNKGLKHYVVERGSFEDVPDLPDDVLTFPFRLDGSQLWLLSEEDGLMTFDLKTRRKQRHGPRGEGKFLRQFHRFYNNFLSVDLRGRIYAVEEESGLVRYDPASRRVERWFSGRADNRLGSPQTITALRFTADGTLWLGTRAGLLRCDPERRTVKEFSGRYSFQNVGITDIAEGPGGLLWLATEGEGILLFDPRTEQFVGHLRREEGEPNSLQFDEVATLFVDRQGFVWVNTDPLGVDILFPYPPGHRFYSRTSMPDLRLSDFSVRGLAEDR